VIGERHVFAIELALFFFLERDLVAMLVDRSHGGGPIDRRDIEIVARNRLVAGLLGLFRLRLALAQKRFTRWRRLVMSPSTSRPQERSSTPVWLWSQSTPLALMMLSSTQRCSSKRFIAGAPFGRRSMAGVTLAARALCAAAGDAVARVPRALPAAATSVADCRNARRSMAVLPGSVCGASDDRCSSQMRQPDRTGCGGAAP